MAALVPCGPLILHERLMMILHLTTNPIASNEILYVRAFREREGEDIKQKGRERKEQKRQRVLHRVLFCTMHLGPNPKARLAFVPHLFLFSSARENNNKSVA